MRIKILWGLPGSGKTHYAESQKKQVNADIISCDGMKSADEIANSVYQRSHYQRDWVILDGLFTTNKMVNELVDVLRKKFPKKCEIRIHYWREDRASCLFNDQFRGRKVSAKADIENMPFEVPNRNLFPDIHIQSEDVVRVSTKDIWVKKIIAKYGELKRDYVEVPGKIGSEPWIIRGEYYSCYGHTGTARAEQEKKFVEFDKLIEDVCPNITATRLRNVMNECVETEEYHDRGYYGTHVVYGQHTCDLSKMYDLIQPEEADELNIDQSLKDMGVVGLVTENHGSCYPKDSTPVVCKPIKVDHFNFLVISTKLEADEEYWKEIERNLSEIFGV